MQHVDDPQRARQRLLQRQDPLAEGADRLGQEDGETDRGDDLPDLERAVDHAFAAKPQHDRDRRDRQRLQYGLEHHPQPADRGGARPQLRRALLEAGDHAGLGADAAHHLEAFDGLLRRVGGVPGRVLCGFAAPLPNGGVATDDEPRHHGSDEHRAREHRIDHEQAHEHDGDRHRERDRVSDHVELDPDLIGVAVGPGDDLARRIGIATLGVQVERGRDQLLAGTDRAAHVRAARVVVAVAAARGLEPAEHEDRATGDPDHGPVVVLDAVVDRPTEHDRDRDACGLPPDAREDRLPQDARVAPHEAAEQLPSGAPARVGIDGHDASV